jgi:type I restriction enzyme S subunit
MNDQTPAVHEALAVYAPETTETERAPEGYKQTEVGVIPEDWEVKSLGEIGTLKNGINKGKEDFGHGQPFVNLLDVFGVSTLSGKRVLGLVNSSDVEMKTYDLLEGDILFIRSSVKPEGVGLTTLIVEDLPGTVFSGFLIRFRDEGLLDSRFKEYCFHQPGFRSRLIASSTVSANTNINQVALKRLQLPIPPTHGEQRAIAAALSDVDALISALDKLISKKRAVKTAAMQQLLTGKQRLPGFSGEWEVKRLGDYAEISSGGTPSSNIPDYYDGSVPWVSITDMTKRGKYVSATDRNLTEKGLANSAAQMFPKGTILYAMYASIGECSIADVELSSSQAILGIRPSKSLNTDYLYFVLGSRKEAVQSLGQQGTQANLNAGIVKGFLVPVPSLEEQTAIAAVLSDMDTEIEALEERREKTRQVKRGMMQELLTGRTRLI